MNSSGLKLRDTRELLAKPDQSQDKESVRSPPTCSPECQIIDNSAEQLSKDKVRPSMSPSLAMANASSSPSNERDRLSTAVSSTPNSSHENEPISKKRRILDATEALQEIDRGGEKQESDSEDILARACFAVGIGGDLTESVVEEPVSSHSEHNGEVHKLAANCVYPRGIRVPHPGMQLSPRQRHPEDIRLHHQIHPAFRPPHGNPYMDVRSPRGPPYRVPTRAFLPPGEPHHYYAVPRFPDRYRHVGPPGSVLPSMTRPPILRAVPPGVPLDRQSTFPHVPPGYDYAPHHLQQLGVHHGPRPPSPVLHNSRIEPSERQHIVPAGAEIIPVEKRHPDVIYKMPSPHGFKALAAVPTEQLSPNARSHRYPRLSAHVNAQPKVHIDSCSHMNGPRSPRTETYVGGVLQQSIHPPSNSPSLRIPEELSCENPFQIPDTPSHTNLALNSKPLPLSCRQNSVSLEVVSLPLERNEMPVSSVPLADNVTEARNSDIYNSCALVSRAAPLSSSQPRRIREPPEPCVELIPITVPAQEEKGVNKVNSKFVQFQQPSSIPDVNDTCLKKETGLGRLQNASNSEYPEVVHCDSNPYSKASSLIPNMDYIPTTVEKINEDAENEDANKGQKRSFRKRWLDKLFTLASEKSRNCQKSEENSKKAEGKDSSRKDSENKEMTLITIDDESEVNNDLKMQNLAVVKNKSPLGPGQLHCLHSSYYLGQMRSASEPPFGTALISNSTSVLGKRPASVPGAAQPPQCMKVPGESQNHKSTQGVRDYKESGEEDEFVDRLKLVLNDLISVPEATKLQHITSPIDELLASLVKQRGALPSKDPNPRQRLRQDFLVLVKLCMPRDLLEDWGWNSSSPEEILDQLIKVANNGVDGTKSCSDTNSAKENDSVLPALPPPPPPPAHDKPPDIPPTSHTKSSPTPIVSLSPVAPDSSPVRSLPAVSGCSTSPLQSTLCPPPPPLHHPTNIPALSPRHPGPVYVRYPAVSPPQYPVPYPSKHPSPSLHMSPVAQHPLSRPSPHHSASSPVSVHHSPPIPQQVNRLPPSRHSLPLLSRQTTIPSTLSEPPVLSHEEHLEDDVFSPTNRDQPNPPALPRLISSQNPPTVSYVSPQIQISPKHGQENDMLGAPTTQVPGAYAHNRPAYAHAAPAYAHGSTAYTHAAASYGHSTKPYTHITTAYAQTPTTYTHSPGAYPHTPTVYANSSNVVRSPRPVAVLHYSQIPRPPHKSPYAQHHPPYANPGGAQNLHAPSRYPRGPYPHPYPYPYYPSSDQHHPHRPPHLANMLHRPSNPPNAVSVASPRPSQPPPHPPPLRQPYSPQSNFPPNPSTNNAVHMIAQPPEPLSPSNWNGSLEERIVTAAALKPPA